MARSPLLRWFRELAQTHAAAERLGYAPKDIRETAALGRRDILRGGAKLGAALAAASPMLRPLSLRGEIAPRIAIVGAGIAGLTAALKLQDKGLASTVFEASHRIGGRMFSDRGDYWSDGQVAEFCGELIDSGHRTIQALAKRFGLKLTDLATAGPADATDTYFFFGRYYSQAQADIDFAPVRKAAKKDFVAAGYPTQWNNYNQAGFELDHMSVHDWISSRVPGGLGSPMGRLLDVAYNEEYGAETSDQSALNILYLLAFQPDPKGFAIFGESDERYHIEGGNQLLPLAIAETLPDIRLGWRMIALSRNFDDTVSLVFDSPHGRKTVTADRVVLTTPFAVLRTLDIGRAGFNRRKLKAINELGAGRNSKLMVQFDGRPWNNRGPWGVSTGEAYTEIGFQNCWETSRGQPGASGLITNYTGGDTAARFNAGTPYARASHNALVSRYARGFLDQFDAIFPGAGAHSNGKATLSTPFRDPNFLCSYAYWRVGQYTSFAGYEAVAQGPVHFAGEHCSTDFQGFMEGGAAEGKRAALEVFHATRGRIAAKPRPGAVSASSRYAE